MIWIPSSQFDEKFEIISDFWLNSSINYLMKIFATIMHHLFSSFDCHSLMFWLLNFNKFSLLFLFVFVYEFDENNFEVHFYIWKFPFLFFYQQLLISDMLKNKRAFFHLLQVAMQQDDPSSNQFCNNLAQLIKIWMIGSF